LIQACSNATATGPGAITKIFTPPDKTLQPGSQAYYALHLWVKPALLTDVSPETGVALIYSVKAYRGAVPADRRAIWQAVSASLLQPTVSVTAVGADIESSYGVPVKVLDGYPVRGDVTVELEIQAADPSVDHRTEVTGTRIWGYYERIGAEDGSGPWRFIGEPPAGALFDTGLPIQLAQSVPTIIHTFAPDRFDEVDLQVSCISASPTRSASFYLADQTEAIIAFGNITMVAVEWILGTPNALRDPKSVYNLRGVFGGNSTLKYLMAIASPDGAYAASPVSVHGRFARH
jgi:hypothetical protein